jgi:hypothetical protein
MIVHSVYFALYDNSAVAVRQLLGACQKYLVDHLGILSFACGTLAQDHVRPVNDRDFDVSLHVVFADKAAHDRYHTSASHDRFVAENEPNWRSARVFDSVIDWTMDHP